MAHQRSLSVLEGLTSVSKAKSLLKSNKEILQEDENQVLFGKDIKISKMSFDYVGPSTSRNFIQPFRQAPRGGGNQMVYISQTVEPQVMEVEEVIQNQDIQPQIQPQAQEVSSHSVVSHPFLDLLSEMGANVHQTLKDLLWEIKPEGNLVEILYKKLKKNYKRPIHLTYCSGMGNKILEEATVRSSPSNNHERRRNKTGLLRNRKHVKEGNNKTRAFFCWPNIKQHIPQGEEKWDVSPHTKSEKVNSYIPYQHFYMEGLNSVKDLLQKGDYMVKIDLTDA